MSHDAKGAVALLQDHLAAHDRPVSFLFGAGTSCCVDAGGGGGGFTPLIPAIQQLTEECRVSVEGLGTAQRDAWLELVKECASFSMPENIESILSRVRAKLDALGPSESLGGLTRDDWKNTDSTIRSRIAELAAPSHASIPVELPHHSFARWIRNTTRRTAVEVFTTNYDVLLERSFDELRVPHFDGFIGSQFAYFSPEAVENDDLLPSTAWVRLWKLHGSVSWSVEQVRSEKRISRGRENNSGQMILPSHKKYDESRKLPYRALMDRLGQVLAREDSLLVVCGFSFGDQHINAVILDALDRNPRTHAMALLYSELAADADVAKWAAERPNLLVIGPNAGVLSGRFGSWEVSGTPDPQLEQDSGGLLKLDSSVPAGFRLRAGDFNCLCQFLAQMSVSGTGGAP